jgi:sulfotransferase
MLTTLHFITGLPRSGSTLLGALLRRNPRFHASMTSPVGGLFRANLQMMSAGSEIALLMSEAQRERILRALFTEFYAEYADRDVVFDTNRI